jgi:hypothetical protein
VSVGENDDIPDPDDEGTVRFDNRLPIQRYGPNGEPPYEPGDDYDPPNEVTPPFDAFGGLLGPTDAHQAHRWAREPDSSLNGIKPYVTPRQLDDLHLLFLGIYDKHHGF